MTLWHRGKQEKKKIWMHRSLENKYNVIQLMQC